MALTYDHRVAGNVFILIFVCTASNTTAWKAENCWFDIVMLSEQRL